MNLLTMAVGTLFAAACAVTGSLWLLHRAGRIRRAEEAYGLTWNLLPHMASAVGAAGGLTIGLTVLHYLSSARRLDAIEVIGWGSYLLIAGASAGHLLVLIHVGRHLWREQRAWARHRGPGEGTLGARRLRQLEFLRRDHGRAMDLRARDGEAVDELVGVLGNPLLAVRRDLSRIPFYGYLGTVCGILLMAQELGRINEATETFQVLSSMSRGLVLAFQTTLVALVAFLPLRKVTDYLVEELGRLEEAWERARDEALGERR